MEWVVNALYLTVTNSSSQVGIEERKRMRSRLGEEDSFEGRRYRFR